jgi:hypothetical protein
MQVTGTGPSISSVADGVANVITLPAGPVAAAETFPGTPAKVGGVMSATVTANDDDALLPAESVAVQVTLVEPNRNMLPEAGTQVTATGPSIASVADGRVKVTWRPAGVVASTVIAQGVPRMTGEATSTTTTMNDADTALRAASAAEHVTVVRPRGKVLPDAGTHETATAPSTASVAVGRR